jgi:hypothetical protein
MEVRGTKHGTERPVGRPVRVLLLQDAAAEGASPAMDAALDPARVDVTICALRGDAATRRRLAEQGTQIRFLAEPGDDAPLALLWRLVRLIRSRRIDVLHLQGRGTRTLGRLAAAAAHIPAVVQLLPDEAARGAGPGALDRLLAGYTARVFAPSRASAALCRHALGVSGERVAVVPVPLARSRRGSRPVDSGTLAALRARHRLPAPSAKGVGVVGLLVAGGRAEPGSIAAETERLLVERVPGVRVLWLDPAALLRGGELEAHLRLLDLAVVPRDLADDGCASVAALGAGVPVVASGVGALAEVVEDGTTGLLVSSGAARELADAAARLLGDTVLRRRLGGMARAASRRFTPEGVAERLERLYREIAVLGGRMAAAGGPGARSLAAS